MNTGDYLTLPCSKKKLKKKKDEYKQFKRLWKDYNFRYLYEDVNSGRRIKDEVIICRKTFGPRPEVRWKMLGNFRNLQKCLTIILQKVLGQTETVYLVPKAVDRSIWIKPGHGILLDER